MKKIVNIIVIIIFAAFIGGVAGVSAVIPDREFSENENRYLELWPTLTWGKVMSGDFQEDLEDYLNDQVAGRDAWITVRTAVLKAVGDTDIGGAYVGKDGYDFEKITPEDVDDALFERNINAVKTFFDEAAEVIDKDRISFLLVPTSGLVMADKLPKNARLFDQDAYIDEVEENFSDYNFVDVRQELEGANDEYIYYRTDHHWTTDGAYIAYEKWCNSLEQEAVSRDELEMTTVTTEFRGSLYSKILDAGSAYDSIWIYAPYGEGIASGDRYTVTLDGTETGKMYDTDCLSEKDKYAFFFGGNTGEVHISGGSSGEGTEKNILVVKDSFANTFVPLMASQYDNVYMVDLRYYNGDMQEYLTDHGITDVLVLYNISNFISDMYLYRLGVN